MINLRKLLDKYLLGTDFSKYYTAKKAFYSEYIEDSEFGELKRQRISREERDKKILSVWIPNLSYAFGLLAFVTGDLDFLWMNAAGESLRWIGRYFHQQDIKSDELFRDSYIFVEEIKSNLPNLRSTGIDTCHLESDVGHLTKILDAR